MSIEIPLKPKNDDEFTTLRKGEKEIVVYAVLCQTDNQTAFVRFHPEYAVSVGKTSPKYALSDLGKRECKNFWSYPKVRAYREAYEQTLAEFLGRSNKTDNSDTTDTEELTEEEKKNLKGKFANKVYRALGTAEGLEELKTAADLGKAAKIIKEEETIQEAPRRYLPQRCSQCDYRSFVESYVEKGEIENTCLRCKALKVAQEQGFHYDPTNLLEPINNNDNGDKSE